MIIEQYNTGTTVRGVKSGKAMHRLALFVNVMKLYWTLDSIVRLSVCVSLLAQDGKWLSSVMLGLSH